MADLEEHAFRRDRAFVVRLVLVLSVALVAGLVIYGQLTSRRTAGCAADAFVDDEAAPEAPPAPGP